MVRVGLLWNTDNHYRVMMILGREKFTVIGDSVQDYEPVIVWLKTSRDTLQHIGLIQKDKARYVGHITHKGRIVQIVAIPNKLKVKPSQPDYILYQDLQRQA